MIRCVSPPVFPKKIVFLSFLSWICTKPWKKGFNREGARNNAHPAYKDAKKAKAH